MYSTVQYSAVQYSTVQPELKRGADASGHVTLLRPFLCGDPAPRTALACRGGWGLEAVDVDVIRWTCTVGCCVTRIYRLVVLLLLVVFPTTAFLPILPPSSTLTRWLLPDQTPFRPRESGLTEVHTQRKERYGVLSHTRQELPATRLYPSLSPHHERVLVVQEQEEQLQLKERLLLPQKTLHLQLLPQKQLLFIPRRIPELRNGCSFKSFAQQQQQQQQRHRALFLREQPPTSRLFPAQREVHGTPPARPSQAPELPQRKGRATHR